MREEKGCRRKDWQDGPRIELADHQVWAFRSPVCRMAFDGSDRGFKVRVSNLPDDLAKEFETAIARYDETRDEQMNFAELVQTELVLGACLLRANYDLSDDDLGELLQFSYRDDEGDPFGTELRRQVMNVVFGTGGPKPSAVGDE